MKKEETSKPKDNSFGIASVVLGIVGLTLSSVPGVILGIVGLIFGRKQRQAMKNRWSRAGIILNIISIILGIIVFSATIISILNNPEFLAQIKNQIAVAQ